jgi:beta-galactosidase
LGEDKGGIARLSAESHLLDDDFWNGTPWQLSVRDLRQEGAPNTVDLRIVAFAQNSAMHIQSPDSAAVRQKAQVPTPTVDLTPRYQLKLQFTLQD